MQVSMGVDPVGSEMAVIAEDEAEGVIDMSPPRVVENRNLMKQVHSEMLADTEEGGYFCRPTEKIDAGDGSSGAVVAVVERPVIRGDQHMQGLTAAESVVRKSAAIEGAPGVTSRELAVPGDTSSTLVAIADFAPPPTHQAQMLKLYV